MDRAFLADALTSARIVMAPVLAALLAQRRIDAAAIVLGVAWATDFLDGRAARGASRPTKLNGWDLRVDAWLAVGQGVGLGFGGYVSWWLIGPITALVAWGSVTLRNPSPVMVGIGALSGALVWVILFESAVWWLPVAYGVILWIVDWNRFWQVIMPALWRGVVSIVRFERHEDRRMVLDEWVD